MAEQRSKKSTPRVSYAAQSAAELEQALEGRSDIHPPGSEAKQQLAADLRELRRTLGSELDPLAMTDHDRAKIEASLTEYENERTRIVTHWLSAVGREVASAIEFASPIEIPRPRGGRFRPELGIGPAVSTLKPVLIMTREPNTMLVDSQIGYSSWAKVWLADQTENGMSYVVFVYLWTNDSDSTAFVDVSARSIFNGTMTASANHGILFGGSCSAYSELWVVPLRWWNQPPVADYSQMNGPQWSHVGTAHSEGGGLWALGGDLDVAWLTGVERTARFSQFAVPAGASAVFEVQARLNYVVDDGYVGFDFSSQPHYSITSQFQLEVALQPL
jgi:hypothetical protein